MNEPPLLAVRGQAILEVEPEIARISLTIAARDADRAKAMRRLNERAGAVDWWRSGSGPSVDFMAASAGGPLQGRFSAPEEFTFDISPIKQTVTAAVEARFRISSPDLGTAHGG